MQRRTFLSASGATLASALLPRLAAGQPVTRHAIVIGVDKAGSLPLLRAAASGAKNFADWLDGEGFAVTRFIDTPDTLIKVDPIFEAVKAIAECDNCQQLVVYFSGHGFLNGYRELWMLSGAPDNPNQAISLLECQRLSKRTGIPNVVFVSDACRSTPASLAANSVRGSVIFPTTPHAGNVTTKVDTFLATQEGDPAYEVGVQESTQNYYGIFTESFLDAYRSPEQSMVSTVDGIEVVLNKDLEGWLSRDVNRRAQLVSIAIEQRPESIVLSDSYIGRVRRGAERSPSLPAAQPTMNEVAALAFSEKGFPLLAQPTPNNIAAIRDSDKAMAFGQARNDIIIAQQSAPKSFETRTGFYVSGARIKEAVTNRKFFDTDMGAEISGNVVRLYPKDNVPASVAIRFNDDSGTVVAGIEGYIGTIVVDDGRVVSVTYTRSREGFGDSQSDARLEELRSLVAASARFGTFRIAGTGNDRKNRAAELADRIRNLKAVDPTLGLYAAYAYAEADLPDKIMSVWEFMRGDIRGQLFDVALLSGLLSRQPPHERRGTAPCCPMLSQGWGLLRIENVELPRRISEAMEYIRPALWTTFEPQGLDNVVALLRDEEVF